jgi:ubiquitin carboxyl-terminal hydrolase 7/11
MKNTCYINSMIQCLFESRPFRDLFLDYKYQEYWNHKFFQMGTNNDQLPNVNSVDPTIRLSTSLAKLFEKMYLNGGCSIVPSGFLKNCIRLRPDLNIPFEQQDTQEFLMFLLDRLHDELSNSNKVVEDYPELMEFDRGGKLGDDYDKWFDNVLLKQGFSPISQNFQGQLQDSLTCMNCGFKSSNYSSFYMLSLGIPKRSASSGKKLKKVGLEDCIELFTNDEILSGENAWDCPKCSARAKESNSSSSAAAANNNNPEKELRKSRLNFAKNGFKFRGRSSSPAPKKHKKSSTEFIYSNDSSSSSLFSQSKRQQNSTVKSLTFVTLPPTLIIHLSRFLFYDTSQKDDTVIQYPLILTIPHSNEHVKYRLFGVVNHSGTLKSGHYTSITNKNLTHDLKQPNWYYFDDEVVKGTGHGVADDRDCDRMNSSTVYVLFYEKM